jgi:hypothetical protein
LLKACPDQKGKCLDHHKCQSRGIILQDSLRMIIARKTHFREMGLP